MPLVLEIFSNKKHTNNLLISFKHSYKAIGLLEKLECLTKIRIEIEKEMSHIQNELKDITYKYENK